MAWLETVMADYMVIRIERSERGIFVCLNTGHYQQLQSVERSPRVNSVKFRLTMIQFLSPPIFRLTLYIFLWPILNGIIVFCLIPVKLSSSKSTQTVVALTTTIASVFWN